MKKEVLSIVLIAVLGFGVYANSLKGEFVWDDEALIEDNIYIKDFSYLPKVFRGDLGAGIGKQSSFYRPLQTFSYMLDYRFFRLDVIGYHLVNTFLHILVAISLYFLIPFISKDRALPLLASLIFVVHPVHTEAVTYISGRADSLAALFMLLTFIFYLKSLDRKRAWLYLFIAGSYMLALLSRENALILPLAMLFYHYAFKRKIDLRAFLPIGTLSLVYVVLRATAFKALLFQDPASTTLLQRIPGAFAAFAAYLKILILPLGLHMEYGDRLFVFTQPQVLIGMLLFIFMIACGLKKRSKDPLLFFSIGWFFIFLFPHSNIYPINAYMSEHWLYLPSIGLFLVIARYASDLFKNKQLRIPAAFVFIALLGSYSLLTVKQNAHWLDPIAFYKRILQYTPASHRVYNNLGKAYKNQGKVDEAVKAYQKAIELKSDYPDAFFNLGNIHRDLGDLKKAEELYRRALELDPLHTDAYTNLGVVYGDLKQTKKAIELYRRAVEVNPDNLEAYNNLGNAYSELREYDQAIVFLEKAISLKLNVPETYYNLGNAYRLTGRIDEAMTAYRQAIELNPAYPETYNNLGICFYFKRDYRQAIAAYKKAVALKPDYSSAYNNLGNAYRGIKDNRQAISLYKKAIQVAPVHATAHNNLAVAYFDDQEFDLAVEYADKAARLGYPVNPRFLELLAPYRE